MFTTVGDAGYLRQALAQQNKIELLNAVVKKVKTNHKHKHQKISTIQNIRNYFRLNFGDETNEEG